MSDYKTNGARKHESLDAVVIGAGIAGLYQLHKLREKGFKVKAYETASGVGGTWYWNRYPGARFDSEAYVYQYRFSEELYKAWSWSERFPGQPEIERGSTTWPTRLDLRKDIQFNTTRHERSLQRGHPALDDHDRRRRTIDTQFLITCCGMLSAPLDSVFPGQDSFKGQIRPHRVLAEGASTRGQARRRGRHRRHRHPGHPDHRRPRSAR